jgi:predicted TIM-barrel fold metal-dependent hydrolase
MLYEAAAEYEIIDCHVHPDPQAAMLHSWYIGLGGMDGFLGLLAGCGIDRALGDCIRYSESDGEAEGMAGLNRRTVEAAEASGGVLLPGLHVDPREPQGSCREVEHWRERTTVRWIGELVGYLMGYGEAYLPGGSDELWAYLEELALPVNLHCADLATVAKLCRRFPRLPVVLAHPGQGREDYPQRLALVAETPNLYLDLSGSGLARYGMLRHGIDRAGPEKFLFGSDAPINNPAMYVAGVLAEPLDEAERRAVFAGNVRRLARLG